MAYFSSSPGGTPTGSTDSQVQITALGTVRSLYGSVTAVANSVTTTVLQYTVPPGVSSYLLRIEAGGSNISTYTVTINGVVFATTRSYFGAPLTMVIEVGSSLADAYMLSMGDVVQINTTNFRPDFGDYEARLQCIEV